MKLVKVLNIKGAVLDEYQLENYLEKIASDHILQDKSDESTYPIPRLKDNLEFITRHIWAPKFTPKNGNKHSSSRRMVIR